MTLPQGATLSVVPLTVTSLSEPIVVAVVARGPDMGEDMVVAVVVFCEVLCRDGALRDAAMCRCRKMPVDSLRQSQSVVKVVSSHERLLMRFSSKNHSLCLCCVQAPRACIRKTCELRHSEKTRIAALGVHE